MYTVMYIVNFNWLRVLVALRPLVLYQKAINNNNNNMVIQNISVPYIIATSVHAAFYITSVLYTPPITSASSRL